MLQIQPAWENRQWYENTALREGLAFEILEFPDGGCAPERAEQYRRMGLVQSLHGAFIDVNPASGDPAFKELSQRRCRESCQAALACGARNIVFHSSCFPFLRGQYLENWAGQCAEFYGLLAEETGLSLFIENSMDVDPTPLAELMRRLENSRVKVCLDLGHANYSRVPAEGWFETLREHIGYLHLSDNRGSFDEHLPLGQGTVDWEKVSRLASYLSKEIPMTLEVGGPEGIISSLAFLKEHGWFGL